MAILSRIKFVEDFLLRMAWVNDNHVEAHVEFPRASYAKTIIWVVVDGKRTIEVNGILYEVQAGDIVVIPPQTPRTVLKGDPASDPIRYYSIGCDLKVGSLHFVQLYKMPVITSIEDAAAFREMSRLSAQLSTEAISVINMLHALNQPKRIISRVNTEESAALLALSATFQLWFARFIGLMQPYLPAEPRDIDPRISELCAYMQQNIGRKLTLSDLAKFVFLSESHLRLLFRKTVGVAPMAYFRQLRLQRAKELLVNTAYTLKEVAEMTGFDTLNQFSRMFSSYEAISASNYRKRYYGGVQG
ncbi:helix-turn-helix domain-containing protein [Paenibacillus allorhizosphaerae]|uniref:HTH-type transcriptional activator RhaR n=1 Tax=Paenibacillus allorhizosphaerae TaxID=2849866 RepID=A0ABM8V9W6_9BACL|nr:AraC family transcriptional regulator [Paenibacillus allorhizosphaerae]CAG7614601.1 HTH-type transcriptional activator RhaR [Paenibacillus allorhizosphaerae]